MTPPGRVNPPGWYGHDASDVAALANGPLNNSWISDCGLHDDAGLADPLIEEATKCSRQPVLHHHEMRQVRLRDFEGVAGSDGTRHLQLAAPEAVTLVHHGHVQVLDQWQNQMLDLVDHPPLLIEVELQRRLEPEAHGEQMIAVVTDEREARRTITELRCGRDAVVRLPEYEADQLIFLRHHVRRVGNGSS